MPSPSPEFHIFSFIKTESSPGQCVYFSRQEAPERNCLKIWELVQISQIRLMYEVGFKKKKLGLFRPFVSSHWLLLSKN